MGKELGRRWAEVHRGGQNSVTLPSLTAPEGPCAPSLASHRWTPGEHPSLGPRTTGTPQHAHPWPPSLALPRRRVGLSWSEELRNFKRQGAFHSRPECGAGEEEGVGRALACCRLGLRRPLPPSRHPLPALGEAGGLLGIRDPFGSLTSTPQSS